jgi:hypothetical protein
VAREVERGYWGSSLMECPLSRVSRREGACGDEGWALAAPASFSSLLMLIAPNNADVSFGRPWPSILHCNSCFVSRT